ncbi:MAG TPA: PadR family transcriptional regulator [Gemmatimonadales bacterium]|jgi:transcriptional regulator
MSTQEHGQPLLPGTLDLLVLRTLLFKPEHGHGIAMAIEQHSRETLLVDHGSLYPALQRLERLKLIRAEWGVSSNNRRARFYELTARGRRELHHQVSTWQRMVRSIGHVLGPEFTEE